MSENLIPFSFESSSIRIVMVDDLPWFVAKDVAETLGYKDPTTAIRHHCKGVLKLHPLLTAGGPQELRIIDQPDTFRLIVGSTLPEAERFEKWVFEEVLPSIYRTGQYQLEPPTALHPAPRIDFDAELETYELCFLTYPIRVKFLHADEPWFHSKDVCRALGYFDTRAALNKYGTNRTTNLRARTFGGVRYQYYSALGVVFRLAAHSTSADANDFERWIVDTALPAIRERRADNPVAQFNALLKDPSIDRALRCLNPGLFANGPQRLALPATLDDDPDEYIENMDEDTDDPDWKRILDTLLEEIEKGRYLYPYRFDKVGDADCLLIRTAHIMDYLKGAEHLATFYRSLDSTSDRVLKRELQRAGVLVATRLDPVINGHRLGHAVAIDLMAFRQNHLIHKE
ncbi:MAG: hypothetical protein H6974_11100 [Gammaproteobacteria bacterium]|nr:hypothetical protein [Gammaproteobacteria bacterium]